MDPFLRLGVDELACVGGWLDDRSVIAWAAVSTSVHQVFVWHAACARAKQELLEMQRHRHLSSHPLRTHHLLVVRALLMLCDTNRVEDLREEVQAYTHRRGTLINWTKSSPLMQLRRFVRVATNADHDWCMAILKRLEFCRGFALDPRLFRSM